MKCFIGIEKKLEDNTMFYREPVKIDKDWSDMIRLRPSKVLNPERLKKIKGNRETLASRLTC